MKRLLSSLRQGLHSVGQTLPLDLFRPLRQWVSHLRVETPRRARKVAELIPAQCPFERDIVLLGRSVAHIPPLCKLNPIYNELVELRFRALCYLADECGEDISAYI
ncbi:Mo-dependent nitrogenase C-terminal domain-containing protein [Leptolyngbya sp. CCNP1308]|uniref:Mo-dependent nitrogenase C-terminal domain-containing protein n=1 Tax=Leptolyngbya sp. CCNP1308 TaxID=3110255 RepID=UPI002B1EF139|nr:Mo-dependent nitrogenase C-terminal domain-containing protein [Leptolyngbya sp. CCNP1308]MEA5447388.1 Mo-dependent nitrogenase C-terminal domain-containing protein [Leptolyngbya sp. CCNP1308]